MPTGKSRLMGMVILRLRKREMVRVKERETLRQRGMGLEMVMGTRMPKEIRPPVSLQKQRNGAT